MKKIKDEGGNQLTQIHWKLTVVCVSMLYGNLRFTFTTCSCRRWPVPTMQCTSPSHHTSSISSV